MANELIVKNGLKVDTTTGAFKLPVLTTTQRNALTPEEGMEIYNTTTKYIERYNGTSWVSTALMSLSDLSNVVITSASNNQYLQFNGTSWVNATLVAPESNGTKLFLFYNY